MSEQWTWQPVDEPIGPVEIEVEYYTHGDGDTATHYEAGYLGDEWVSLGDDVVTTINWGAHVDYRLCRRVPAQGVPVEVRQAIAAEKLREALSEYAHEAWSNWMNYLLSQSVVNEDGTWTVPADSAERWYRQMTTPYFLLPESEKASDRAEADKMLTIMYPSQGQESSHD